MSFVHCRRICSLQDWLSTARVTRKFWNWWKITTTIFFPHLFYHSEVGLQVHLFINVNKKKENVSIFLTYRVTKIWLFRHTAVIFFFKLFFDHLIILWWAQHYHFKQCNKLNSSFNAVITNYKLILCAKKKKKKV